MPTLLYAALISLFCLLLFMGFVSVLRELLRRDLDPVAPQPELSAQLAAREPGVSA